MTGRSLDRRRRGCRCASTPINGSTCFSKIRARLVSKTSKSARAQPTRKISIRWRSSCGRSRRTAIRTRATGSVYFKISTLPQYGRLARLDHDGLKAGARVDSDNYDKDNARDFVLWKATKAGNEPSWDFGFGRGRPGWHLECSAMALRLLGEPPIDIHCGGVDLIFPHHENEIAQSEGATGKQFARVWMHVEHLLIDEEKMSKSLGNVFNLPDIVAKGTGRPRSGICCSRRTTASS